MFFEFIQDLDVTRKIALLQESAQIRWMTDEVDGPYVRVTYLGRSTASNRDGYIYEDIPFHLIEKLVVEHHTETTYTHESELTSR